jgi:hypothetical protein
MRSLTVLVLLGATLPCFAAPAFVTVRDDGTLAALRTRSSSVLAISQILVDDWNTTGVPLPEMMSVWTTFPFDGSANGTYALNQANDTAGIGFDGVYGGDGTFPSANPPSTMITLHNDVTKLATRRAFSGADGSDADFARYLFLLEQTHRWGPALRVSGPRPNELIGFLFHWSFYLDAGGSPAGGNRWKDNGDGTFTAAPQATSTIAYSPLDLYLMGLADPSEVSPFGVLEGATVRSGVDPMTQQPVSASTFPVLGGAPVLVAATRRVVTIDEVIGANGARMPARASVTPRWSFGVMLVVGSNESDDQIAAEQATFAPIAASFVDAFHTATGGRATLEPVTLPEPADLGAPLAQPMTASHGCAMVGASAMTPVLWIAVFVALGVVLRRRATSTL